MSSTVADALVFLDDDKTKETRLFIRLIDQFFDCLNVTNKLEGVLKRKEFRLPYTSPRDQRFKVRQYRIKHTSQTNVNDFSGSRKHLSSILMNGKKR